MIDRGETGASVGVAATLRTADVARKVDTVAAPATRSEATERSSPAPGLRLLASGLSVIGAVGALAIGGGDSSAVLVVVSCLAACWAMAGVVVTVRHRCPAASIVAAIALAVGAGAFAWSIDTHRNPGGAGGLLVDLVQNLALTSTAALVFQLLLTLPDGNIARTAHRRVVLVAYVLAAVVAVALLANRDEITWWPIVVLWAATAFATPAAYHNYRVSAVADQRRMQWIGWALVVASEVALVCVALSLVADWPNHSGEIALASSGLVPIAIAAGTIHRLQGRIARLLTHTVSLAGLTALIVVAYLIALAAFGRKPNGSERSLLLLSMLAAGGAAIAYQPARSWLTERANRLVYGERFSPDEALRTWGSRLTRAIPLDELLLQLVETLRKSMQLRSGQIWTGANGRYEVAAMVPHRQVGAFMVGDKEQAVVSRAGVSGGTWLDIWLPGLVTPAASASTRVAPIAHAGALLGMIVCERAPDSSPFTEEDDRVLTELARQVALALHNVQLDTALQASLDELRQTNDELRASRSRIVAAGDSERRKLERNLHDGAQQHLVALAVKLRLAKDAVVDDPADAEAMIDEIRGDLQGAIAELRALAHGIFPPLLISGGLAEALPAAAGRAALPTSTDISIGRHDQEVEAAVYFCCMEALQNAGKHAGADATAVVRVWEDDAAVHWEVADDGAGFDLASSAGAGHGFVNIRDRMGAFGGTMEVVTAFGAGTTIRGHVPLR
jgi:signal transduction histidine kinase